MNQDQTSNNKINDETIEKLLKVDQQISTRLGVLVVLLAGVIIILFATLIRESLPDLFSPGVISGPSIRQNPPSYPNSYPASFPGSYPASYISDTNE